MQTSVGGYASSITYQPNRLISVVTHTNGVAESWLLDRQMARPLRILVSGAHVDWQYGDFTYDGAGNITATGGTTFNAEYGYDTLGRLVRWTEREGAAHVTTTRTYDDYGNYSEGSLQGCTAPAPGMLVGNCYTTSFQPLNPDSSTNHYPFETYDAAGNVRSDAVHSYGYDGNGTMTSLTGSGRDVRYVYTADDERIAIVDRIAGTTTWTLRGTDNRLLRTFTRTSVTGTTGWNWTEDEIWRGSQLLASESPSGSKHYHLDHLGSPRLITASNGTRLGEQRYTPFGRGGTLDGGRIQFTGHEADRNGNRQGLIYAHARYLEVDRGRFLAVDPGKDWDLRYPQSWNLYTYVRNNPINTTDPTGRKSYIVTRASVSHGQHMFIVTHARFPGDPQAKVFSYGQTNQGNVGRVDHSTKGFSEGTSATDKKTWVGIRLGTVSQPERMNYIAIPAPDARVEQAANAMRTNADYKPVDGPNSNSAAQAVAEVAAGKDLPTPDPSVVGMHTGLDETEAMKHEILKNDPTLKPPL